MRAEVLYTTEQGYIPGSIHTVELYEGASVQLFGRGEGTVDWAGTEGTVEWTNFPPRRPDGMFMPNITGLIQLAGMPRPIMYRMHGISLLPDRHGRRLFAGTVRWFTDEPDFLWLNDVCGYEEGSLEVDTGKFRTRAHTLHPEPPPNGEPASE